MKQIIKYQSDGGSIHDTELEATRADAEFYKNQLANQKELAAALRRNGERLAANEPGYDVHDGNGHM